MSATTRSLDSNRDDSARSDPPLDRPDDGGGDAEAPLRGGEATSTVDRPVDRRAPQEQVGAAGQDGDLADGDEGSATGSRTPGQDSR